MSEVSYRDTSASNNELFVFLRQVLEQIPFTVKKRKEKINMIINQLIRGLEVKTRRLA